jgi:hypothetical protein
MSKLIIMENFNPQLSFEITSSKHFFEKLEQEYGDFDKDHLSARHAINCALTSWHLTDWTYAEFFKNHPDFQDSEKIKRKKGKEYLIIISGVTKYQDRLIKKCSDLKIYASYF